MSVSIKTIVVSIGDVNLSLTLEEARKLKEELNKLFGSSPTTFSATNIKDALGLRRNDKEKVRWPDLVPLGEPPYKWRQPFSDVSFSNDPIGLSC